MRIIKVGDPNRIKNPPKKIIKIFSSGGITHSGFKIKKVELRSYNEFDSKLRSKNLITSFVDTDKGSIEMMYDEGFEKEDFLEKTAEFLVTQIGLSSLILRSTISLREALGDEIS